MSVNSQVKNIVCFTLRSDYSLCRSSTPPVCIAELIIKSACFVILMMNSAFDVKSVIFFVVSN